MSKECPFKHPLPVRTLFLVLLACGLPSMGRADNWVNVPQGSAHQVDTDSIRHSGAFVLAWTRSVYPVPIELSGEWAYSEKSHLSFNCSKKSQFPLQTITFADPDSTVRLHTFSDNPTPNSYQRTDQVNRVILSFVCKVASQRQ